VQSFERVGLHVLRVGFADGSKQTIDFSPVLLGELYGPLSDPEVFGRVRLDPEVHTQVWPNGADFDPATLHDWPTVADELQPSEIVDEASRSISRFLGRRDSPMTSLSMSRVDGERLRVGIVSVLTRAPGSKARHLCRTPSLDHANHSSQGSIAH
jgi:hypothetical protein